MTDYSIEKGIPITFKRRRSKPYKYEVLDKLAVTDSVVIDVKDVKVLSASITWCSKRDGKRFTCRSVENGVRVWRTV